VTRRRANAAGGRGKRPRAGMDGGRGHRLSPPGFPDDEAAALSASHTRNLM